MADLPDMDSLRKVVGDIQALLNISGVLGNQGFDFEATIPVTVDLESGARLDDIFLQIHIPPQQSPSTADIKVNELPLFGLGASFTVDFEGISLPLRFKCQGDIFPDRIQLTGYTLESWLLSVGASNLTLTNANVALNISSKHSSCANPVSIC